MSTAVMEQNTTPEWQSESPQARRQLALHNEVLRLQKMVQEQAAMIEDLQRRATEDGLTGLLNRRGFDLALEQALSNFNRYGRQAALLVLDLNDFKTVNDTLGHQAGDAMLRHIAHLLQVNTRDSDIIARPGGDEFCIILRENTLQNARRKAEELEKVIASTPCCYDGREITVTASIGACTFIEASHKADLIARADANMYRRKADSKSLQMMV